MKKIKISIICVVYNRVSTIEQLIMSVTSQTYSNIEFIIIDGGSTDGTIDIINKYIKDIQVFISENDDGIYDAMNKGVRLATGDYIQIIGSDDCLYSCDTIQRVVDCINKDTDFLSANRYDVDEKRKIQLLVTNETAKNVMPQRLPWMPHTGIFVKNEYIKSHLFDTSYEIVSDYKFIMNAYMDERVVFQYVDFPVAYFSKAGISHVEKDKIQEENIRLSNELNFEKNFNIINCGKGKKWIGQVKRLIKYALDWIGILNYFLCKFGRWEKHCCDNKICRWCGRG